MSAPKPPPPGMIDVATDLLEDVDSAPTVRDGKVIKAPASRTKPQLSQSSPADAPPASPRQR